MDWHSFFYTHGCFYKKICTTFESRKIFEIFCKRADTLNEERVNAKRIAKHCKAHSKGEKLVVPAERAIFQVRKCI